MSRVRERMRREEGFTLVELLVVILIIAILAAAAVAAFLSQQDKAHDSAMQQALHTSTKAAKSEAVFNDDRYPAKGVLATAIQTSEPGLTVYTADAHTEITEEGAVYVMSAGGRELEVAGKSESGTCYSIEVSGGAQQDVSEIDCATGESVEGGSGPDPDPGPGGEDPDPEDPGPGDDELSGEDALLAYYAAMDSYLEAQNKECFDADEYQGYLYEARDAIHAEYPDITVYISADYPGYPGNIPPDLFENPPSQAVGLGYTTESQPGLDCVNHVTLSYIEEHTYWETTFLSNAPANITQGTF